MCFIAIFIYLNFNKPHSDLCVAVSRLIITQQAPNAVTTMIVYLKESSDANFPHVDMIL